jgi:hypothetical protein
MCRNVMVASCKVAICKVASCKVANCMGTSISSVPTVSNNMSLFLNIFKNINRVKHFIHKISVNLL